MTTTPTLTLVPDGGQEEDLQDLQITDDGRREFIAKFLQTDDLPEVAADAGITSAAAVMDDPAHADLLAICEQAYQKYVQQVNSEKAKKRSELEFAKQQRQAKAKSALKAKLREMFNLPQALKSQNDIKSGLVQSATSTSSNGKPDIKPTTVDDRLASLQRQFGRKLPDFVFNSPEEAVMFRQVLRQCIEPYHRKLRDASLDTKYRAELVKLRDQIQYFFRAADAAVTEGWNLDLQTPGRISNEVVEIMSVDDRYSLMMYWMGRCPTSEELLIQNEFNQKIDTEKLAAEAAKQQRRDKLQPILKARMLEVRTEHLADAERVSYELAKKYGDLPDIVALFGKDPELSDESVKQMVKIIFTRAAAVRMESAKQDSEKNTAKDYAKLADITEQELETAVGDLRKQKPVSQSSSQTDSQPTNMKADRIAREKARKERRQARQAEQDAARPKPNVGSGDPSQGWKSKKK